MTYSYVSYDVFEIGPIPGEGKVRENSSNIINIEVSRMNLKSPIFWNRSITVQFTALCLRKWGGGGDTITGMEKDQTGTHL